MQKMLKSLGGMAGGGEGAMKRLRRMGHKFVGCRKATR